MTIAFKGYAIVSADGFIADEAGRMPEALRFDADWTYFQAALDAADFTLLGRHTHEAAANVKRRSRLVVSRGARAVIQEDTCTWWVNSEDVTPTAAVSAVGGSESSVAVVGGTGVFGWVLAEACYAEFHLTIAWDVLLGRGRALFDDARDLDAAVARLEDAGLVMARKSWLDPGLELLVFKPVAGEPDHDVREN